MVWLRLFFFQTGDICFNGCHGHAARGENHLSGSCRFGFKLKPKCLVEHQGFWLVVEERDLVKNP